VVPVEEGNTPVGLTQLGLSQEAEAIYRTMLAEPTWGVADLASHLSLPERSVRKALDQLADLELLLPIGEGGRWQPVPPGTGLAALLRHAEAAVHRRQIEIDATRTAIATIASEYQARNQEGDAAVRLEGVDSVRTRLSELAASATKECWSFSPGAAHRAEAMDASRPLNLAALARGVQLRCVYQDAYRNDPATAAYAQWLTEHGGSVRTVPALPMQLVVVDRSVALLPVSPVESRLGAIEVRSPGVLAAICALFEQVWSTAIPFGESTPRNKQGLSPQETEILRLMAAGHTDDSVARKLDLSVRTVRRTIADLHDRLAASSRFQAGVNAVRQGWL
jgi:DNA-binding CsgD family transcriptional regulator